MSPRLQREDWAAVREAVAAYQQLWTKAALDAPMGSDAHRVARSKARRYSDLSEKLEGIRDG